jgi:uncharacterized phage protein (TIGR02220 family)
MKDQKDIKKAVDTLSTDNPFLWGYTLQDNGIWETGELNTNEKLIYLAINSKVNNTSAVAFPSYNTLAKMTSMSKPTVIKCVKRLVEVGLLTKTEIAYNSNRYTIKMIQQCSEQLGFKQDDIIKRIEKRKEMTIDQIIDEMNGDDHPEEPGDQTEKKADPIPYKAIIDYLNEVAGTKFSHKGSANQKLIKARWNEGFGLEEFKKVIEIKVSHWKGDSKWGQYLRPSTLFGNRFDQYLNEKPKDGGSPGSPAPTDRKQQLLELLGDD